MYWLLNVRLEERYIFEGETVVGTETSLNHILIKNGKIEKIISNDEPIEDDFKKININKQLALPPFAESHFHLDKSYFGGSWKAVKPINHLMERLEYEAEILPTQLSTVKETAQLLIDRIIQAGSTHIRTHVNIDPYVGLKHLEYVREALEERRDCLTYEIVAFPQHGLLRSDVVPLMRQAMKEGATLVGGVDPAGVDKNVDRSLAEMMDIAVEADAGIDIHLHDSDFLGVYTMNQLFALTEEAGWNNRVAISHGFGLGGISEGEVEEMADRFVELGVSLISTAPMQIDTKIPPIPLLKRRGVNVALGCDSIFDWWGPFGNADILERVSRLAEYYRLCDERSLAESLGYITQGVTPLNTKGEKVWPQAGDDASMVLVESSCSAETVARRSNISYVLHKGKLFDSKQNNNKPVVIP